MKNTILIIPVLLLLYACSFNNNVKLNTKNTKNNTKLTTSTPTKTIFQKWKIITLNDFSEKQIKALNSYINIVDKENGNAYIGCNQINFTINLENNNKLKIEKIYRTKMFCQDKDIYETALLTTLKNATSYTFENNSTLIINGKNNNTIKCKSNN